MNTRPTLFISDLHLSAAASQLSQAFFHFLNTIAPQSQALYILGDFFEFWLGAEIEVEFQNKITSVLQNLKTQNIPVYFMKGNRDFLLRDKDIRQLGLIPIPDPYVLSLDGQTYLLTHGDRLCTLDRAYQRYRRIANIKVLQCLFLHSPLSFRKGLAQKIHAKNPHQEQALHLDYTLADAYPASIEQELKEYRADVIIHGHTHRMGVHWHGEKRRFVLGDWKAHYFNYLSITEGKVCLHSCPF